MKFLTRKLWFSYDVNETLDALFRIPQMQELFDEGFAYGGEMRPKGIKICSGYWPADAILDRLPQTEDDIYFVLTSMDLKGDFGRIHGKGRERKSIMSNYSFLSGICLSRFDPCDIGFQAIAFHEVGHALGLKHHEEDAGPCAMIHKHFRWKSLDDIRFCSDCYNKISPDIAIIVPDDFKNYL